MTIANPYARENEPNHALQQLLAGRYRLIEPIGSGRLGDIFAAEDVGRRELGIDERAAVQLLPDPFADNTSLIEKLELGYAALRAAAHPGIVSYINVGRDSRRSYVVMELLHGVSIREVLRQSDELPLDEVVPVIRAVGEALQFLHSQSIVHGKVTPENVFVTEALDIRLLDVIPLASSDPVLRGVAEQNPLNRTVARDDVFGLACLAYEMLTGRHPFNYQSMSAVMKAGLEPEPIAAIPVAQWHALRRTLVANADDSIRGLAEFLKEFGISGSERLPEPSYDELAVSEPAVSEPAVGASTFGEMPPEPTTMVISADDLEAEPERRPWRMRTFGLLAVLIALGAWYVYGEPQARVVATLESIRPAPTVREPGVRVVAPPVMPETPAEQPAETVVADEPANPEALAEAPPESAASDIEDEPEATEALAESPPATPASETPAEPDFAFDTAVVTVSEQDGAARVTVNRAESPVAAVSWWVTGHTAIAGEDYVDLRGELSGGAQGNEESVLLVPLVNDATAEPIEVFFIHLGRRLGPGGQLEPVDTVRVDIFDDD
jgi:hypothetical protein